MEQGPKKDLNRGSREKAKQEELSTQQNTYLRRLIGTLALFQFMPNDYEFGSDEIERAFAKARGRCECCEKELVWEHSCSNPGRGSWEAHHGNRYSPIILCTGEPENCHLNCGHDGDFQNPGITPRTHKGG
jgi:hypothetical protein